MSINEHLNNLPDLPEGTVFGAEISQADMDAMNAEMSGAEADKYDTNNNSSSKDKDGGQDPTTAAMVAEEQEQSATTEQKPEQQSEAEDNDNENAAADDGDNPEFILIDGEQIPYEDARKFLSMGKDATKKWQEASEMKRTAESLMEQHTWVQDMQRAWGSGPDGQRQVIEILAQEAGMVLVDDGNNKQVVVSHNNGGNHGGQQSLTLDSYGLNESDLSDEGQALYAIIKNLEQKNTHLATHNTQLNSALTKFEQFVEEQKSTAQHQTVAKQLTSEFGLQVTVQDIQRAMLDTKVQDPYAAWLKANAKNVMRSGNSASSRQQQPTAAAAVVRNSNKPNSPAAGHGKTFDPNKYGPDKVFEMLMKGYEPTSD